MKRIACASAAVLAAALAGCGAPDAEDAAGAAPADTSQAAAAPGDEAAGASADAASDNEVVTYDAAAFHNTTSFSLASGAGLAFAPDNGDLLITSDETGVFNAYAADPATGERTPLTRSDADANFALSWFPQDRRILVTADRGGDERNHVYVVAPDGTRTDLTPGEDLRATFAGWSGDYSEIWITTNERDPQAFDLYAYDAETFEREMVFENPGGFFISAATPDRSHLVLSRNNSSRDTDLFIVDMSAETPEPVLITPGEEPVAHTVFDITPDGSTLVYGTNAFGEFTQAWTYDIATGETAPLIEADWDVSYVAFSPTGRYRVTGVNADARTEVSILDTNTGEALQLPDLPAGDLSQIRMNEAEDRLALSVSSSTSPANIHLVDLAAGEQTQLTAALNPAIDPADMVEAEVVRFESFDGLEIPGILYRPHGASAENPVPAMVWVHGGPGGQSRLGYSATIQHLVNHGYAIYMINNRGSSGYGKTFYHMDDRDHGGGDLNDVVASGDWLREMDWVRDDAVGVIGGSYGGYIVAAALAFHPEAFDAGINIFGVTNWVRTLESIPDWWGANRDALYDELGDPATDGERLRAISPLFHADNIVRPMLVIQGANDPRVLQQESDDLVAAAREAGAIVEYVIFPDEGHGFQRKENRITASEAYLAFADAHLKGGAAP